MAGRCFSERERRTVAALAATTLPSGRRFPAAGAATVERAESFVAVLADAAIRSYRAGLAALEAHSLMRCGHELSALPLGVRLELLEAWGRHEASRVTLRGLLAPIKLAFFDDRAVYESVGCRYGVTAPQAVEEQRWQSQIVDGLSYEKDEEIECDAVVVGTGAGGAVVAKELAEAGWAVLLLEEGPYFSRKDFTGRTLEMSKRLYRNSGLTLALGNTAIPIPVGRGVGGTTMINAGTCLRPAESVFADWRSQGLTEFSSESMDPYFRRVEAMLRVAPADMRFVGSVGRIIGRGCDALGYSHGPLDRNAPDCDGQGYCVFGCPTDAKRSTNVSYVPAALDRSAMLVTNVKVERVLLEGDYAVGVAGVIRHGDGRRVKLTARAKAVVLSCGSLHTPNLLLRQGLANASGQLGRNLSIHPASAAFGVFDEVVDGTNAIPQGYSIDQFKGEGIMFEGGTAPLEILASTHPGFGPAFVDLFERFANLCQFGFMVKDTSRGRVRPGRGEEPLITYRLNDVDLKKTQRALTILARVFFAAGAREVHMPVFGFERLRRPGDVDRLAEASLAARHVDLTAWHPLGTAKMGPFPLHSVVDARHETHDVHNLFIVDGSSVPGSLGVNPQLTIMAMATRASEHIAARLQRLSAGVRAA